MQLSEYQQKTTQFVIYPKQYGLIYTVIGLADETSEFFEQYNTNYQSNIDTIRHELGDCLFYLANICTELDIQFSDFGKLEIPNVNYEAVNEQVILSGKALGSVKKMMRDDDMKLTDKRKEDIIKLLEKYYKNTVVICKMYLDCSVEDVMKMNCDKLTSRRARNVISGDGSDR